MGYFCSFSMITITSKISADFEGYFWLQSNFVNSNDSSMKKIFSRRDPLISLGANNTATTEKEPIKVSQWNLKWSWIIEQKKVQKCPTFFPLFTRFCYASRTGTAAFVYLLCALRLRRLSALSLVNKHENSTQKNQKSFSISIPIETKESYQENQKAWNWKISSM